MRMAPPTIEGVERIGRLLRDQDRVEVLFSNGLEASQAVLESWRKSEICRCIYADDELPVGLCGVSGNLIWLLATDELLETPRRRRQFATASREWVDSLFDECGYECLHNWALASNTTTLRWLRWLGFTVDVPEPMGASCQLFSHFWRVRRWS